MSMIGFLKRATDEQLDRLLADPRLIEPFVHEGQDFTGIPLKVGWLGRLLGMKPPEPPEPAKLPADWPASTEGDETDLDKSWHGLHFLLTGSDWEGEEPLCYLIQGGEYVGDIDVGYGPARALKSEQVGRFAEALSALSPEDLRQRFDPERMQAWDIYPTVWVEEGSEALETYLLPYFDTLREFVQVTADQGKGLVVWLA